MQKTPLSKQPKGLRELEQVKQISLSSGAKITAASSSGSKQRIIVSHFGIEPDDPRIRAMLNAIEGAVRGQFDRGQRSPGMTQFTLKNNVIDVAVRCVT